VEESRPSKPMVAGSNPVPRSKDSRRLKFMKKKKGTYFGFARAAKVSNTPQATTLHFELKQAAVLAEKILKGANTKQTQVNVTVLHRGRKENRQVIVT
jgi:hypothetical protein